MLHWLNNAPVKSSHDVCSHVIFKNKVLKDVKQVVDIYRYLLLKHQPKHRMRQPGEVAPLD